MRFFDRRLKSKDFVICWLVGKVTKRLYGVRIAQCSARVVRIYLCAANQKLYSSLGLLIWSEGYHLIAAKDVLLSILDSSSLSQIPVPEKRSPQGRQQRGSGRLTCGVLILPPLRHDRYQSI